MPTDTTIIKTGDWLYDPVILVIAPISLKIGSSPFTALPGSWIDAFEYFEEGNPSISEMEFSNLVGCRGGISLGSMDNLTSLAFPEFVACGGIINLDTLSLLTTLDLSALVACGSIQFDNLSALEVFDLPALTTVQGSFAPSVGMTVLTTISLPAIVSVGSITTTSGSHALTDFTLGSTLKRVGGDVRFNDGSLNEASVDNVLVRLAALDGTNGTSIYQDRHVELTGWACAPPSAAGLAAKATLEGRGNTVNVSS